MELMVSYKQGKMVLIVVVWREEVKVVVIVIEEEEEKLKWYEHNYQENGGRTCWEENVGDGTTGKEKREMKRM